MRLLVLKAAVTQHYLVVVGGVGSKLTTTDLGKFLPWELSTPATAYGTKADVCYMIGLMPIAGSIMTAMPGLTLVFLYWLAELQALLQQKL